MSTSANTQIVAKQPVVEVVLAAVSGFCISRDFVLFEALRFKEYRESGINRLSIGVQSFNDKHLKALGRIHGAAEAISACETAKAAGFDNFNIDLMHGLPDQTTADAVADVQQALDLLPTHLSYYQLTLEPNTFFAANPPKLPDEQMLADIQEAGKLSLIHI